MKRFPVVVAATILALLPIASASATDAPGVSLTAQSVTLADGNCVDSLIVVTERANPSGTLDGTLEVRDPQNVRVGFDLVSGSESFRQQVCDGAPAGNYTVTLDYSVFGIDQQPVSTTFEVGVQAASSCVARKTFGRVRYGDSPSKVQRLFGVPGERRGKSRNQFTRIFPGCAAGKVATMVFDRAGRGKPYRLSVKRYAYV